MKPLKFGGKLDMFRRNANLTISGLASKSRVPEKTIERIIAGKSAPKSAHFVRLMRALKINFDIIEPEDLEEDGIA